MVESTEISELKCTYLWAGVWPTSIKDPSSFSKVINQCEKALQSLFLTFLCQFLVYYEFSMPEVVQNWTKVCGIPINEICPRFILLRTQQCQILMHQGQFNVITHLVVETNFKKMEICFSAKNV